ncbi:40S ribosomal protein s6 [Phtheirospermum japonicum]|uniref:40S ribosomal protein s6 n=1 Tax=Phtheirospermum japonicum TaxID=374723 RepID=A0A830D8F4_9LAMI|nr:40S ribosomal protein s6 [Phtheirospermum japonicum]
MNSVRGCIVSPDLSLLNLVIVKKGKKVSKAPKIQGLVTPLTLQRKRARNVDKKKRIAKAKPEAAEYQKLLASRLKEQREKRSESLAKKRSRASAASKTPIGA